MEINLFKAGIVLLCICGGSMNSPMANVLFSDRGRAKIGTREIRCPTCGAIYRQGEWLKYRLVHIRKMRTTAKN